MSTNEGQLERRVRFQGAAPEAAAAGKSAAKRRVQSKGRLSGRHGGVCIRAQHGKSVGGRALGGRALGEERWARKEGESQV